MRFTSVHTGAPACVGDGLYGQSSLQASIDSGMLMQCRVLLDFQDGTQVDIFPYLVGDAAFPLGQHMLKFFEPPPAAESADAVQQEVAECTSTDRAGVLFQKFLLE
jgi:hypothetical protein